MKLRLGGVLASLLLACAEPAPPTPPASADGVAATRADPLWTRLPGMATTRHSFTTTLLTNGRVLVAGGMDDAGTSLKSAELYDPDTQTFAPAGAMSFARTGHTATMLRDGRVLVTGGPSPNLELYTSFVDGGGAFTTIASLAAPRSWHTATMLDDGRVLFVGGDSTRKACELFDPADAGVRTCASTGFVHQYGAATPVTLPSGDRQVVVAGGSSAAVEFYDAVNDQWTPGFGTYPEASISFGQVIQLFDGGLLLPGAGNNFNGSRVGVYDLKATASFTIPHPYDVQRTVQSRGQSILEPNGNLVLVAGGAPDISCGVFTSTDVMELTTGPFSEAQLMNGPAGLGADTAREFHGAVLLPSNDVLVVGGQRRWGWAAPAPNTCVPTLWAHADAWVLDLMGGGRASPRSRRSPRAGRGTARRSSPTAGCGSRRRPPGPARCRRPRSWRRRPWRRPPAPRW